MKVRHQVATGEIRTVTGEGRQLGREKGFTLVELMIVVAVVAILAAIAYPSYQNQVRKSRRAQAKADLVESAQILERYHTVNNSYGTSMAAVNGLTNQSPRTGTAQYTIAISNQAANTYTLTATPTTTQGQNKDSCGTLTLNQAGARGSGASGTANNPDCF